MRSVLIIISNAFQSKLISHPEWTLKTVCLLFCWWVGIVADRDMFVWILIRSLKSCTNALLPTTPIFMCLNLHCDWIHKMDFRWKKNIFRIFLICFWVIDLDFRWMKSQHHPNEIWANEAIVIVTMQCNGSLIFNTFKVHESSSFVLDDRVRQTDRHKTHSDPDQLVSEHMCICVATR